MSSKAATSGSRALRSAAAILVAIALLIVGLSFQSTPVPAELSLAAPLCRTLAALILALIAWPLQRARMSELAVALPFAALALAFGEALSVILAKVAFAGFGPMTVAALGRLVFICVVLRAASLERSSTGEPKISLYVSLSSGLMLLGLVVALLTPSLPTPALLPQPALIGLALLAGYTGFALWRISESHPLARGMRIPLFLMGIADIGGNAIAEARSSLALAAGTVVLLALVAAISAVLQSWSGYVASTSELEIEIERASSAIERETLRALRTSRELELSQRRYQELFAVMNEGVLLFDEAGRILEANPRAAEIFGCTPRELAGQRIEDLLDELDDDGAVFERRLRVGTGTVEVEVSTSRVAEGEDVLRQAVIRDISARRRVERMKQQFISTVSHELRTPLTSIRGSLGLIRGLANGLSEKHGRLLEIAYENSERLIHLVNDILDLDKLSSGGMELRPVNVRLRPLLERAIELNSGLAERFEIDFELAVESDGLARVDPDRFLQVLSNLMSNAVKASKPGQAIRLGLESRDGWMLVTVEDRGSGIPESFRDRLFERFSQAPGQKGGTGLGLAIVRELVEAFGGEIGFDSTEGAGTTFIIELPEIQENPN